ncbi:SDR family NAD(P)-dependent oxidoreductase [Sphingobacterium psychroaquaticum]|uniref:SDR family NAD(P)-dependent oxidoreductase n=1 Tax=Sphingobacterium psychroaquaticum TaxID=561061 RepID=UPI00106D3B89|nr:SDR family NAD(P)-dependent oxidoreductase [Sphingobacterium psychroaquaticum]QBQ42585.1 SDR family NAD(P)-dependent oxidoreductase [Sphingobacterium psychroaquaticum]
MILVTGGTGFLGSTLIQQLIQAGQSVTATKRNDSIVPSGLEKHPLVRWVEADVTDYFALSDLFTDIQEVYHCAAKISYHKEDWDMMLHVNIEGTKHIVNLCLEHNARLVHVSSIASLGNSKNNELVGESTFWDEGAPHSKYSLSKYESEMEVWRGIVEGLDAVIVNPSVIMGAGTGDRGSGKLFSVIQKGLRIYPSGSVGIVDVEDVAKVMVLLMNDKKITGERFILNSENVSNKHLLEQIAVLLDKPAPTIQAKPFMMSIAWRAAKLAALFSNKQPTLTRETAKASSAKLAFSNKKIKDIIGYTFKPVDITLKEMSLDYK